MGGYGRQHDRQRELVGNETAKPVLIWLWVVNKVV